MKHHAAIRRRSVLVDSSAYFALTDAGEANYAAARAIATRLAVERWQLVTTNFIVAETHALFVTRLGPIPARAFLRGVYLGSTSVTRVDVADEERARAIIFQYEDKDFSFTNATSFAVMARLGIGAAFTFDHHFAQFGLVSLMPSG